MHDAVTASIELIGSSERHQRRHQPRHKLEAVTYAFKDATKELARVFFKSILRTCICGACTGIGRQHIRYVQCTHVIRTLHVCRKQLRKNHGDRPFNSQVAGRWTITRVVNHALLRTQQLCESALKPSKLSYQSQCLHVGNSFTTMYSNLHSRAHRRVHVRRDR
jgi:hypothetical protein